MPLMQIDASVSLSCDVGNLNSNVPSCFLCSFPPLYYFLVPFLSFEREKNHEMSRLPERCIQILPKSFFIQNQILFRSYLRRTEKNSFYHFFFIFSFFLESTSGSMSCYQVVVVGSILRVLSLILVIGQLFNIT